MPDMGHDWRDKSDDELTVDDFDTMLAAAEPACAVGPMKSGLIQLVNTTFTSGLFSADVRSTSWAPARPVVQKRGAVLA